MLNIKLVLVIASFSAVAWGQGGQRRQTETERPVSLADDACSFDANGQIGYCDGRRSFRFAGKTYNSRTHAAAMENATKALEGQTGQQVYQAMSGRSVVRDSQTIESSGFRKPAQSTQAVVPFGGTELSECTESCTQVKPYWIYVPYYGIAPVVQIPGWITQWIRWCKPCNQLCYGQTGSFSWWWGRCVTERGWKRILIWRPTSPFIQWVWVKVDLGCCCVPWQYATSG